MVDGFCKEIIVDAKTKFVVRLVVDSVLTKGHVTDSEVIKITAVGGLKASHGNVCLRIQLFGDAPGNGIQFYTIQAAVCHAGGQHSKEIAHAHGRLQNVARLEAHALHRIINRANYHRGGVVGIQHGAAGGGVFVLGE